MKRLISVLILLLIGVPVYAAPVVINGANIQDNTVTNAKLIDNNVSGTKIQDNTIVPGKVAATGTPSSATYLRGDGSWGTPSITTATTILSAYKNLRVISAADSQSVTITATQVVAAADNNEARILSTISVTVNLDVAGANGLDTGSLAANTGYYLYVIDDGATTAGLASLSATTPTMPAGYTYKTLVGWCTTDGTTTPFNIAEFTQIDDFYVWTVPKLVFDTTGSQTTRTLDLSVGGILSYAVVPPDITKLTNFRHRTTNNYPIFVHPVTFANTQGENNTDIYYVSTYGGSTTPQASFSIPMVESQTVYHQMGGSSPYRLYVLGFVLKR